MTGYPTIRQGQRNERGKADVDAHASRPHLSSNDRARTELTLETQIADIVPCGALRSWTPEHLNVQLLRRTFICRGYVASQDLFLTRKRAVNGARAAQAPIDLREPLLIKSQRLFWRGPASPHRPGPVRLNAAAAVTPGLNND